LLLFLTYATIASTLRRIFLLCCVFHNIVFLEDRRHLLLKNHLRYTFLRILLQIFFNPTLELLNFFYSGFTFGSSNYLRAKAKREGGPFTELR
jgi:hypothetical protein